MTNASSQHNVIPSSWRSKSPGISEFTTLINLFEGPALLVDRIRNQVICANSHFCQLTAFAQMEVIGNKITDLIPDFAQLDLSDGTKTETLLNRRQREPIEVMTTMAPMDTPSSWVLLTLIPLADHMHNQAKALREDPLLKSFHEMANLTAQPDLNTALSQAIQLGRSLLNADLISIYKADSQFPQLRKIASSEDTDSKDLPEVISSADLIRLREPILWQPGKRVAAELHRNARIAGLNYLASIPLGQAGAWFGLLAIGDHQSMPVDNILKLTEIIATQISSTVQHYIVLTNYNDTIQKNKKTLMIQSSIAENAQEGVIILNPDLTIVDMNPAAELILGYASSEVIEHPAENILIGTETLSTALKSATHGITTQNISNLKLHRRNGQSFPAYVQTVPVQVKDELVGIILFLSDISENEQIRVRTQQLEQRALLGEVTAIFAHEVRNPINNISTGLQLMAMGMAPEDPNQELISRLENDCARLTHLMETVLTFSRPKEIKMEPTDISVLIQRITERWRPRFSRAKVIPYFSSELENPRVDADPRALEQVFTNLISNAVHAMSDKGGTLSIKISKLNTEIEPPQIELTVSDTGPGIPDDIRDRIFEPFVTTNPQGTGLGLAITKQIITAHRGSINLNSFPGGTVFMIKLPAIMGEGK